ncbi:hypothetical protein HX870_19695 [Pseudomonas gingeri]|uniref:Uncharacterized protein n=1 Tax=Pseudomonas gingeri TaxID=117681 RepID=A0A7Y7XK15_9PSED|nr:hypothetical protein [Pseudomonas gingeri]NWA27755.1 hypothetical protein [Pseudomonas gingeri]NWC00243.1 hypothetical protein [Pseudomonas gingeri]NWD69824.1 hypothetical protein [Pseudomonas gingeri]
MKLAVIPSSEDAIRLAQPEDELVLMAACAPNQVGQLLTSRPRPVGTPTAPPIARRPTESLTLTSSTVRAWHDSANKTVVLLSIKKRFLKKIPESLNGWSCEIGSPLRVLQQQAGQTSLPMQS